MYCTEAQLKEMLCWRTLGTDKEKKCYGTGCPACEPYEDIYYLTKCPHCTKKITAIDVKGQMGEEPLFYCGATRRR